MSECARDGFFHILDGDFSRGQCGHCVFLIDTVALEVSASLRRGGGDGGGGGGGCGDVSGIAGDGYGDGYGDGGDNSGDDNNCDDDDSDVSGNVSDNGDDSGAGRVVLATTVIKVLAVTPLLEVIMATIYEVRSCLEGSGDSGEWIVCVVMGILNVSDGA